MFAVSLVAALAVGQLYQAPRPIYDPAGYHRIYPEWIGSYVSGVGNPRTIEMPVPPLEGDVTGVNYQTCMIAVTLDDGEKVLVHYGPGTIFRGNQSGRRIAIDKMNRSLTFK